MWHGQGTPGKDLHGSHFLRGVGCPPQHRSLPDPQGRGGRLRCSPALLSPPGLLSSPAPGGSPPPRAPAAPALRPQLSRRRGVGAAPCGALPGETLRGSGPARPPPPSLRRSARAGAAPPPLDGTRAPAEEPGWSQGAGQTSGCPGLGVRGAPGGGGLAAPQPSGADGAPDPAVRPCLGGRAGPPWLSELPACSRGLEIRGGL